MNDDQLHGFYSGVDQHRGFYSDRCRHKTIVKDMHEGTIVCTDCAKVLDSCFYIDINEEYVTKAPYDFYAPIEQYLVDICTNGNIPNSIRNDAFSHFKLLKQNLETRKFKVNDVDIIVYALYEILARHNTPRTPQEMQGLTNVSVGRLWKIETKITCQTTYTDPADYVNRYATFLDLSYTDIKSIIHIIHNIRELDDVRPRCLVAAIFYLYCKQNNIKNTLKKICEVCSVSTSAAHNIIKKIKEKNDNINKLMCTYLSR
jgi:transcription initiation factor TFIIIB Brf1 subunit/transcription initiation factor TFIIB